MRTRDAIVIGAVVIVVVLIFKFIIPDPPIPATDPGKAERDSTEQASKVDLDNSVREKQWADSVLQRAADIANSRDRERIVTNTESYARSQGLDTMSYKLTTRK